MEIPIYQVDAFTTRLFGGNPAAVCPLNDWLPDATLQAIAAENNLAETAFFIRRSEGRYDLRWFTPGLEIDLCGHATLASAKIIFEHLEPSLRKVTFDTKSGALEVTRTGKLLELDFPSRPPQTVPANPALAKALGATPAELGKSRDHIAVFATADEVRALKPDIKALTACEDVFAVICTAPGDDKDPVDFVSRFFAPRAGIDEDPVTGSAHCTLIPYWASRLGRTKLSARQISPRVGELECELRGDRVGMAGECVEYLVGTIHVK